MPTGKGRTPSMNHIVDCTLHVLQNGDAQPDQNKHPTLLTDSFPRQKKEFNASVDRESKP